MKGHSIRCFIATIILISSACGDRDARTAVADTSFVTRVPIVGATDQPYREAAIANPGAVRGRVRLEGDVPRDTVLYPSHDQRVCGDSIRETTLVRDDGGIGGVVVWLLDARQGRALPLERRYELQIDRCRLTPRVQAVLVGGTLNVRSRDPVLHRTRFTREGRAEPVSIVRHSDAGQVVPDESILARPGRVKVSSDSHPWMRAWLLVFDHPFFTETAPDGRFAIEAVPPGRYRILAWHERFGTLSDSVTIEPDKAADIDLRFR